MIQTNLEENVQLIWKLFVKIRNPKLKMWNTIANVAVAFVYQVSTGDDGERTYVKFESPGPAFVVGGGGVSWVEIWAEACCTAC